jgi:hypothetical protein
LFRFYFHVLLYSKITIPTWFELFFRENFSITTLTLKYSFILRKLAIYKYIQIADHNDTQFVSDIRQLIKQNNHTKKWIIHPDFPLSVLVNTMRPYIYIYYLIHYSDAQHDLILFYKTLLYSNLNRFAIFYPLFGRRKKQNWFRNSWKPDFLELETEIKKEFHTDYFHFCPKDI